MDIRHDNLTDPEVIELLREHLRCVAMVSPPESVHALDLDGLRRSEISFFTIWNDDQLAGCGALKELEPQHGEIKSMRTAYAYQRMGIARRMLEHLIEEGRRRGYRRISLETGSAAYFEPARRLYLGFGFELCEPFGAYLSDPNSIFMTLEI